ncbi:uncharacterized protein LOC111095638 isoform X2 [Canis lupus familiaris]|uniref:uncharacterized protein LOC111095638 isoform X2 n=1 Tax=Canis lupus familiaris TaxID=9615 RepID=UPI0015F19900|nr:uncharacterized protein LOC111095638 isoform X2 [Canis lupus familiaris]XP_038519838.1 uncharacterized protein LOC111095638 isoform X2 [Canis lupus familiaris]
MPMFSSPPFVFLSSGFEFWSLRSPRSRHELIWCVVRTLFLVCLLAVSSHGLCFSLQENSGPRALRVLWLKALDSDASDGCWRKPLPVVVAKQLHQRLWEFQDN